MSPAPMTLRLAARSVSESSTVFISDLVNLGAVTTLWAPPATCSSTTIGLWVERPTQVYVGAFSPYMACGMPNPSEIRTGYPYNSPAICPSGWTSAYSVAIDSNAVGSTFLCCPSGFEPGSATGNPYLCSTSLPSGFVITNVVDEVLDLSNLMARDSVSWPSVTLPLTNITVGQTTDVDSRASMNPIFSIASSSVVAAGIIVGWQTTDQVILELLASLSGSPFSTSSLSTTGSKTSQISSSTSPTNTRPPGPGTTHTGISAGAKAGIAVALVLFFILMALAIFFYFRCRGQRKRTSEATYKAVLPNTHELLTNANFHEMLTKHNTPEMEVQDSGVLKPKAELAPAVVDIRLENENVVPREDLHELDPNSRITALNGDDHLPSAHELETSVIHPGPQSARPAGSPDIPTVGQKSMGTGATSSKNEPQVNEWRERKVELLKDRIKRIREEKERLERIEDLKELEEQTKRELDRIQELKYLEEQTKREILEASRNG